MVNTCQNKHSLTGNNLMSGKKYCQSYQEPSQSIQLRKLHPIIPVLLLTTMWFQWWVAASCFTFIQIQKAYGRYFSVCVAAWHFRCISIQYSQSTLLCSLHRWSWHSLTWKGGPSKLHWIEETLRAQCLCTSHEIQWCSAIQSTSNLLLIKNCCTCQMHLIWSDSVLYLLYIQHRLWFCIFTWNRSKPPKFHQHKFTAERVMLVPSLRSQSKVYSCKVYRWSKAYWGKAYCSKTYCSKRNEAKRTTSKHTEARCTAEKRTEARRTEAKHTEARRTEARRTEARCTEAKRTEARCTEARHTEAKRTVAQHTVAKCTAAKSIKAKRTATKYLQIFHSVSMPINTQVMDTNVSYIHEILVIFKYTQVKPICLDISVIWWHIWMTDLDLDKSLSWPHDRCHNFLGQRLNKLYIYCLQTRNIMSLRHGASDWLDINILVYDL